MMGSCQRPRVCQNSNTSAEIYVKISNSLLGLGLLLGATNAAALSLGEVRGGVVLGRVLAVHNHGAGDLLEIAGPGLKTALLLPFTLASVPTVDLAAGRIVVDLPEGLD